MVVKLGTPDARVEDTSSEQPSFAAQEEEEQTRERTVSSQSSDDDVEWELHPLEPLEMVHDNGYKHDADFEEHIPKESRFFSVAMDIPRKRKKDDERVAVAHSASSTTSNSSQVILRWKQAAKKVLRMEDPFGKFHLEKYEAERVLRYRYNPLKDEWVKDEILVKVATEPFGRGAMRECFRLKRVRPSQVSHTVSTNYVAKRYINPVDRCVYMEDVKLQMYSKLWGEEFNRHNPPKKVDFCQMSIIEFLDRPDKPIYHLEHFIEGKYIKYNSNSGFIECEKARFTPQAFSHFTFEKSGHEQIVVDIQGVGDLYTDPQIHTYDGTDFNEGNLGVKGMALFFQTHVCNPICTSLGLTPFDLDSSEVQAPEVRKLLQSAKTCVRVSPLSPDKCPSPVGSPSHSVGFTGEQWMRFSSGAAAAGGRQRTYSSPGEMIAARQRALSSVGRRRQDSHGPEGAAASSTGSKTPSPPAPLHQPELPPTFPSAAQAYERSISSESDDHFDVDIDSVIESLGLSEEDDAHSRSSSHAANHGRRVRCDSECSFLGDAESDKHEFQRQVEQKALPSSVAHEEEWRRSLEAQGAQMPPSILGLIHVELARYHENGRFNSEDTDDPLAYNQPAALHHVKMAARCGNVEGLLTMARLYSGASHELLEAVEVPEDQQLAMHYLKLAATAGDPSSAVQLAKRLDEQKQWDQAAKWYERAVHAAEFDEGVDCHIGGAGGMDEPVYTLLARLAALYGEGGNGLEEDKTKAYELYQQAAESAMAATKGRLANKYYELAECL